MTRTIDARSLKSALRDGGELAILDVREEVDFFPRHLLFACCVPLGRLELLVDDLVPRRGTRIVVVDAADGYAPRAAKRLEEMGYQNVWVLDGGVDAWAAEGFEIFSGTHVPSKAFGEFVEEQCATPRMPPEEIQARIDAGEKIIILDSRPFDEYRRQSIPGGIDCPGVELAYRVHDLAPDPETLVVVNCAGRTRSIIGTQSLLNAGIPNQVVALKNGTMGWHLAGLPLERGQSRRAGEPTAEGLANARACATRMADAAGVLAIDATRYAQWKAQSESRTLYVLDVRNPEEYEAGHLPEAVSAPGGQLVQETDVYAATRNARIVLVDDTGVRARVAGAWLRQMGWPEVAVLDDGLAGQTLVQGKRRGRVLGLPQVAPATVSTAELARLMAEGSAVVIDFAAVKRHQMGHIPGAFFGLRANVPANLERLPSRGQIVLTSSDGMVAMLAAGEVAAATGRNVRVLAGGTNAWIRDGQPVERGCSAFIDEPRQLWTPYERTAGDESQMQAYLDWEGGLTRQLARDGDTNFRILRPQAAPRAR